MKQAPAEQNQIGVVRDEDDHRLQAEGGSDSFCAFFCNQTIRWCYSLCLPPLSLSRSQMNRKLVLQNLNKSPGPDSVSPRAPKAHAEQLFGIPHQPFNLSLTLETVPNMKKIISLVPVLKKTKPTVLLDYKPVALES